MKKIENKAKNNFLLNTAAQDGDIETVIRLITTTIDINKAEGKNEGTPITNACKNGHAQIVKLLLEAGADVNCPDASRITPLIAACDRYMAEEAGVAEVVKLLLGHGARIDDYKNDKDGAIHYAAMFGYTEAVRHLVNFGTNVNIKGNYGRTPLIYAVCNAKTADMAEILLNAGADINGKNDVGENALFEMITRDKPNTEVAKLLINRGIDLGYRGHYGTALHWAAFCGRANIVEVLLDNGADVNSKDKNVEPPIIRAMSQHKTDVVKLLFKRGADPDSSGQFGFSLLEYAAEKGDKEFVEQIIKRKKELESGKKDKKNKGQDAEALLQAAKNGDLEMVKLLLSSGIDINEFAGWGHESPLMKAAYYGKLNVVKYLLKNGADIRGRDSRGNTALLHAAWSGHTEVVKVLIEQGADIKERNNLNWNALMQACVEGHYDIVQFLLGNNSPTDEIDKEKGATALTLAKYSGNTKIINLLEANGAKERSIRKRQEHEDWFSIFDCEICQYLAHKKDLGRMENPEKFEGLETIHSDHSTPYRYVDATELLLRCSNCGTYYHQYHYIDSEDAFIAGPSITHNFQRYNFLKLKEVLRSIGKIFELQEIENRYPAIVNSFLSKIKTSWYEINPHFKPHVIETLTDFFIMKNDWDGFYNQLLQNPNADIVLDAANDIIVMLGQTERITKFPSFTNYRNYTHECSETVSKLISANKLLFKKTIQKYKNAKNETIQNRCNQILKSAKYYKIW